MASIKNYNNNNNDHICPHSDSSSEWSSAEYALEYLEIAEKIPHKNEGEKILLEYIPADTKRILDLGTGDGRLIKLIKSNKQQQLSASSSTSLSSLTPEITVVDVSPTMKTLTKLQERAGLSNPRRMLKKLLQDIDNLEKFYTDREYRNKLESASYLSSEYFELDWTG